MTETIKPMRVLDAREGQPPDTSFELLLGEKFGFVTRLINYIPALNGQPAVIVAEYDFTGEEDWALHHFPPPLKVIMPAHLQMEAIVQSALLFGFLLEDLKKRGIVLAREGEVKFGTSVFPGDTLVIENKMLHLSSRAGKVSGRAWKKRTNEETVSSHEFTFLHFPLPTA